MIHFRHLLNLFFVFPMQYIVNENANDWIRTAELWCQKRPIYHLRHHHIPKRECFLTCLTVLLPPTAQFWHCTVLALQSFGTAQFWHCKWDKTKNWTCLPTVPWLVCIGCSKNNLLSTPRCA